MSDLDALLYFYNDLEMRQFLLDPIPVSREEEEEWIRSTWEFRKKKRGYIFAMDNEHGELIGSIGIGSISPIHQSGDLGITLMNKEYWGKGYGTDAMRTILSFGFQIINLHRVELEVHASNKRAIRVYDKIGFTEVGTKRKAYFVNGSYEDTIVMDILREEFTDSYDEIDLSKHSPWLLK